ncbi:MAG: peptidoglycan-binding protein [Oligoflexales bacterium]
MILRKNFKTAVFALCTLFASTAWAAGNKAANEDTSPTNTTGTTTGETPPSTGETTPPPAQPEGTTPDQMGARPESAPTEMVVQPVKINELNQDQVKQVQTALNQQGATLQVDGKFGLSTKKALNDFQTKNNISSSPDQISADTLRHLGLESIMQAH